MTLDPSKLNDRVRIERREMVEVETEFGFVELVEQWVSHGEFWAHFMPATGREFFASSYPGLGATGEEKAVFRVHYRENLRQVDRLVHLGRGGNRVWNIRSIVPVRFKDALDLHCTTTDDTEPAP